jgi:transcriptional regulator with XRE-family HTH domain
MQIGQLPDDFGGMLASLRQGKAKQAELAKMVGVDGSTISRYESGDLVPSLTDAQAVLKAIGTQPANDYSDYLSQQWRWLPRPSYNHPDRSSLWEAERALQRIAEIRESVENEGTHAQAEIYEAALKREAAYVQTTSHDIAFFGQIGVGKTTGLSTATGLMLPPAPDERRIKRTVLEVGGGNTTICEVLVLHDPTRWGLIVLPQSEEEIAISINDLCAGVLFGRAGETGLDGESRGLPKEVDRALRNMCGLPKRPTKTSGGKRTTIDPMLELADGRNLETLASEVFKRLKLWQRTRTDLWYDSSSGEEPASWLRRAFADVNNGRTTDVGLPKQITVIAPLPTLSARQYRLRVIDTKGIDEPLADRPDLRSYLEDPRTIPVLCSGFTTAPDPSVMQLLHGAIETGTWPAVAQRSVVLVLPKNDEALQVKHDSGEMPEDFEEGYEIKADKIRDALRKIGRDAGRDGLPILTYNADTDDPEWLIESLVSRIEALRATHTRRIEETARAVDGLAEEAFKSGMAQVYERVYKQLSVIDVGALARSAGRPFEKLISAIRNLHPRTVWASVVRQGSWINLDAYHYIGTGVAADAQERSRVQALELEATLGRMLADDDFAPVHEFLKEAVKSVGYWRNEFLQSATRLGKDSFRPALKAAMPLWNVCAAEYGRGYGFRDRVAAHFQDWFDDPAQTGVFELVETALAEQWSSCFAANVDKLVASMRPSQNVAAPVE